MVATAALIYSSWGWVWAQDSQTVLPLVVVWIVWMRSIGGVGITVFGKHCECIVQKCTHLERLPPVASDLLLQSHCVLTRHGGKKIDYRNLCVISGIRIPNTLNQDSCIYRLSYSNSRTQWVVPYRSVNADYFKLQITTFYWGPKNSVNAENNESFIYILFKLYMQV